MGQLNCASKLRYYSNTQNLQALADRIYAG